MKYLVFYHCHDEYRLKHDHVNTVPKIYARRAREYDR